MGPRDRVGLSRRQRPRIGSCLRRNHPYRLRPAHQGMKWLCYYRVESRVIAGDWIPACAGMTDGASCGCFGTNDDRAASRPLSHHWRMASYNPELFAGVAEYGDGAVELLPGVGRGELHPDPGLAPGHHGEAEAHDEYAPPVDCRGELDGLDLIPEHDGHYGVLARDDVEAQRRHRRPEVPGVLPQGLPQAGIALHYLQGLQARR